MVLHGNRQDAHAVTTLSETQSELLLQAAADHEAAAAKLRRAADLNSEIREAGMRGLANEQALLE